MRRPRLAPALLLSLVLHLGLGLLLLLAPPEDTPPPVVRQEPVQFEVVERPAPPRVEPPRPPEAEPPPPPRRVPPRPPRTAAAPAPAPATPPPEDASTTPDTPPAASQPDAPRAVVLLPSASSLSSDFAVRADPGSGSTGRTLRPGDGPSREELLAEERERVRGRVQGFLDDGLARLRVENGLVDFYFGDMDDALEKGLSGAPLFAYEGVLKHFLEATPERAVALRELAESYQRYGANGTPESFGEPSGTERLEDVARSGGAGARARALRSKTDILEEYSKRAGALSLKLELEQSHTGQLLSVKLLEGSGNPLFDTYVLERVPDSLSALGPASESFGARRREGPVRSVWAVEGHVSFKRTLKLSRLNELDAADAAYFAGLLPVGLLSGNFEETRGEIILPDFRRPHFDIRTELLRVY